MNEKSPDELQMLRERINGLDVQIASLLNERMRAADEAGKIKRMARQEIVDLSREKNVLARVQEHVQHPVLKADISKIYSEIMQESRIAQYFFAHQSFPFERVGIIGIGLIGGSICKALKTKNPSIEIGVLVHASDDHISAHQEGWIDSLYYGVQDMVRHCDLIILASPLSTISAYSAEIHRCEEKDRLIVVDVSSVKGDIVKAFAEMSNQRTQFVGTHPMAGKETNGFLNSQPTLFVNRPWVITPHDNNDAKTIELVKIAIQFLGGNPLVLGARQHDRQAALISHLPALLSRMYVDFVAATDSASVAMAGPGYQSFTRLAHDNPLMRVEIESHNKELLQHYLQLWMDYLLKREEAS